MQIPLPAAIATTLALLQQFDRSLTYRANDPNQEHILSAPDDKSSIFETSIPNHPSPLPLLSVSTATLKSQVTKLSLLCINSPFTPSAVSTILRQCNDSILPSLVTATLLISPDGFAQSYSQEARFLAKKLLEDVQRLVDQVGLRARRADVAGSSLNGRNTGRGDLGETEKKLITEQTAKVWEDCDHLKSFAEDGVGGFIVQKARAWLDLMKDAVKELQDWDPEEDEETNRDSATIKTGVKVEALKVLTRIPQSINAIIKHRLAKMPDVKKLSSVQRSVIDRTITGFRTISENIDESAESMYMGDPEGCLKKAGEARQTTIEVIVDLIPPWQTDITSQETKEDTYVKSALDWIRQVHTITELPEQPRTPIAG